MSTVSVIIPTYNRARKVVRAISSVLKQTYKDVEIIVIDDGSSDETENILKELDRQIVTIVHKENLGVSAARNTGIRAAKGEFIAFLDSDDYWLPKKLEVQIDFFKRCKSSLICQVEEMWFRNGRRVNPGKKHEKPSGFIFGPSLKLCLVSPSSVVLKRSLIDEVGLFDEDFPVCEDYDLWLRIASRHPIYLIEKQLVVKEGGHPDQLSSRLKGMDRFRIKSILKLLESEMLNKDQIEAAVHELSVKCRIYGNGCIKRKRVEEGKFYLQLPEKLKRQLKI